MESKTTTIIVPSKTKWKWINQFGLIMMSVLFLALMSLLGYITYISFNTMLIFSILVSLIMLFLLYQFKRFIQSNFFHEKLILNPNKITIEIWSLVGSIKISIDFNEIQYFGQITTDYQNDISNYSTEVSSMSNSSSKVILKKYFLVEKARIEVRTSDKIILFGKNLASWDIDELINKVEYHTGVFFNK